MALEEKSVALQSQQASSSGLHEDLCRREIASKVGKKDECQWQVCDMTQTLYKLKGVTLHLITYGAHRFLNVGTGWKL